MSEVCRIEGSLVGGHTKECQWSMTAPQCPPRQALHERWKQLLGEECQLGAVNRGMKFTMVLLRMSSIKPVKAENAP